MAKKAKKEIKDDDLLGSDAEHSDVVTSDISESTSEESNYVTQKKKEAEVARAKTKRLLGYHPITGVEVWSK